MTTLPYYQVDAFAERPFTGNPAGVMPLESEWLDEAVMQALGEENNLAETAFIIPDASGEADYELRWFTPQLEIKLCGHATLASGHIMLASFPDRSEVTFRTRKAGILTVRREESQGTARYSVALPAIHTEDSSWREAVEALGAAPSAIRRNDERYNLFIYDTEDAVRALDPDFKALAALGDDQFICTAPGSDTDVVSRVFVPGAGVDEDSVTGSAHAVLTPYWTERLGRDSFSAFQASQRGGHVGCRLDDEQVWLTGGCVTVLEGRYTL